MYGVPAYPPAGPPPPVPPPQPPQGGPSQAQNQAPPAPAGSYAARSAQAHADNPNVNVNVNGNVNGSSMNMMNPNQNPNQYSYVNHNAPGPQMNNGVGMNNGMMQQASMPSMPPQQFPSSPPPMPNMPPPNPNQPIHPYPQPQPQQQQPPMQYPNQPIPQPHTFHQPAVDHQTTLLNQSIRRMQESTHIMRGAMEANDLSTTLDRAAAMLGELGDPKHHHHHRHHKGSTGGHGHGHGHGHSHEPKAVMSPKHYYELHMMALDELPNLEEYFLSLCQPQLQPQELPLPPMQDGYPGPPQTQLYPPNPPPTLSMVDLYEIVQYCPRAVPRLYLQICCGSALLRSGESLPNQRDTVKFVLNDLKEAVRCVQCPVRGLFLRHYLLQAVKDKLPDEKEVSDVVPGLQDENDGMVMDVGMDVGVDAVGVEDEIVIEDMVQNGQRSVVQEPISPTMDRGGGGGDLIHNQAVDDLMGDLGVDLNITLDDDDAQGNANDNANGNGNGNNGVEDKRHNDALNDIMGGLGVDVHQKLDFMDEVLAPPAAPATTTATATTVKLPAPAPSVHIPPQGAPLAPPSNANANASASGNNNNSAAAVEDVDDPNAPGTVKDSYQFVLSNFIEMNKLWVRIQHMPGDSKTRETKRKRERERNELRMMVGTNLVRLSELEGVTSAIYGTIILPKVLDHIVACHDPLAQAYLMDCIIQVFPDEFHIQTLEVVLNVCHKLREKVNIQTILQSVMNRLANYYADELLLNDEEDTEGVKTSVMLDSFSIFDECIKKVLDARGIKLTAKEVIRLEASLLDFSLKCYPGRMDHIDQCLDVCAAALRGEGNHGIIHGAGQPVQHTPIHLDDRAIEELEKLLSLPLEELALGVLELHYYSELLALLPWDNRKKVSVTLLKVLDSSGETISSLSEMDQLFAIIAPLLNDNPITGGTAGMNVKTEDQALVARVIHTIYNDDTDVHFNMLNTVKRHLANGGGRSENITPLFYSALKLLNRVRDLEFPEPLPVAPVEEIVVEEDEDNEVDVGVDQVEEESQDVVKEEAAGEVEEEEVPEVEEVPKVKEEVVSTPADVEEEEDDLSYDDDDNLSDGAGLSDGISLDENNGKEGGGSAPDTKVVPKKDEVDELAAELNNLVGVSGKEEEATVKKDDLFADAPLIVDDVPPEDPVPLPKFTKQVTCRKIFLFIQSLLSGIKMQNPQQCFNLSMQAAAAADSCAFVANSRGGKVGDFTSIAYTFFTEAFLSYEGGVSDSKAQVASITSMVGTLLSCKSFESNDYETLITKVAQYAARLLKKIDQCKMVMLCSHLFYSYDDDGYRNANRVLECLQRSLKVANMCVTSNPGNLQLFVDILDTYLYHFEKMNPIIVDKYISGLIALVNEHINTIGPNVVIAETKAQFFQIVKYIEKKKNDAASSIRFGNIAC